MSELAQRIAAAVERNSDSIRRLVAVNDELRMLQAEVNNPAACSHPRPNTVAALAGKHGGKHHLECGECGRSTPWVTYGAPHVKEWSA